MFCSKWLLRSSRQRGFSSFIKPSYSAQPSSPTHQRKTILDIQQQHRDKIPITCITAHDYITGKFANESNVDAVLIGDSLSMVQLGYPSTNQLKFDEFTYIAQAVSRAVTSKYLICDLPFGSYESSVSKAVESAMKLFQDCDNLQAIKIEGGVEYLEYFKKLDDIGIAVCGHYGLTPQRHAYLGGYKLQGGSKKLQQSLEIFQTCLKLQNSGKVKMLVLECIPQALGRLITQNLDIPTISIGAGKYCSGQILVQADLLGMTGSTNNIKFVKQYASFYDTAIDALNDYDREVKNQQFPGPEHSFMMSKDSYQELDYEIKKMVKSF
ncbi:3-methyl-2-oxobutanoate hydroxymethyltransferase [Saccharomycopsis crataegensis]|uniref:3-methyl-2-oxobutanoate hydroxymethyltransferase n=1 Tax=Saccharomycopsis crataegensis TaxID=43959 RepID=A0AAV5QGQ4_9ASCO|nr:3-methyl-2-oxobutanoate hydroxymethyltransferase [Saccharomycopsis crataegensis]